MSPDAYAAPTGIRYIQYESSKEAEYVSKIRQLISKDLSEPYSIYVYRYFLYQWGDLCFMVSLVAQFQVEKLTFAGNG
jgi:N-alpha-acetyltransferase 30